MTILQVAILLRAAYRRELARIDREIIAIQGVPARRQFGRAWTAQEIRFLKTEFDRRTVEEIASELDRTPCAVHTRLGHLGLLKPHAWTETEIQIICDREAVGDSCPQILTHLPGRAGLSSLAQLHRKVIQDRIEAMGWPRDLRMREAQILSLIWDRGPLTKKEICEALGMPFRGAKGTLKANEPGGTYMATLMRRGMLVSFRRAVRTGRRGGNVDVYSLPLNIQRRAVG